MSSSSNGHQQHLLNGPSTSSSVHCCEICGQSGLTDDKMLEHTQKCHVEGKSECPFCGMTDASSAELLLHVNQAHLDYLTPENELMSFIDDSKSPSGDDSDSMSCGLSPSITEVPAGIDNASMTNNHHSNGTISKTTAKSSTSNGKVLSNGSNNNFMDDNNNSSNNCDMANGSGNQNGVQSHGEGSPLRSQLGLKLKAQNKPKILLPTASSPLMCLMCPYITNDATTLEEHINRSHFDPISPGINNGASAQGTSNHHVDTSEAFSCPICIRCFETGRDLEVHVNHEHLDILSPAKVDSASATNTSTITLTTEDEAACNYCPVCGISFLEMKTQEMELHIDGHFTKSPTTAAAVTPDLEKEARKVQEQREFEMLRAQYGMDDQGNYFCYLI